MHNYSKFDYVDRIARRKHIIVDEVRYIWKESNNTEETDITWLDNVSYVEYENLDEFKEWVLSLSPGC